MRKRPRLVVLSVLVLVLLSSSSAWGQTRWRGPDSDDLPFASDGEILAFLREAEVVKKKEIPQGLNKPLKVRLRKDGVEANAIFRTVNIKKARYENAGKVYLDFHDSFIYECAAYEVSRLLGIDNVPPCVVRTYGRRRGTMQLWVEDAMTEIDRRKKQQKAPDSIAWVRQQQTMRLFDGLIYNFDRNQGNILIDRDWKMWFIDHTRSFYKSDEVEKLQRIIWVERDLWGKLRGLDRASLVGRLGDLLDEARIGFVLERRAALVSHIEGRIAELGEDVVLFDASRPGGEGLEESPDYAIAASADDIPEESSPAEEGGGEG